MRERRTTAERFAASWRVDENGCHVWTRQVTRDGYGSFWNGERRPGPSRSPVRVLAHRWSYEQTRGLVLPAGVVVRHLVCDNPPCVNPDHLAEGTQRDNVRDAIERGRHVGQRMLSDEELAAVRASYRGEYGDITRLADELRCSKRLIQKAVAGLPRTGRLSHVR